MISLERRGGRPLLIGHRGAAALAPENTLRAMRAGLAAGVDLIEFDVLALTSGELVVAHSHDLFEVSHGRAQGMVREQSLEELREIEPELATLDEVLAFFADEAPGVGAHVDVKSPGKEPEIAAALSRHGIARRSLVSCSRRDVLQRIAGIDPRVRTAVSFPEDRLKISGRRGSTPFVRLGLRIAGPSMPSLAVRLLARSGATALALHHDLVSPRVVERVHRRGAAVVAWTLEDPAELARVERAGVDAVVLNDPGMFGTRSG